MGENSGGGRFSKRSASPGPPPEEWLGSSWFFLPCGVPMRGGGGSLRVVCGHGG